MESRTWIRIGMRPVLIHNTASIQGLTDLLFSIRGLADFLYGIRGLADFLVGIRGLADFLYGIRGLADLMYGIRGLADFLYGIRRLGDFLPSGGVARIPSGSPGVTATLLQAVRCNVRNKGLQRDVVYDG
jgi:hypothetical protein